MRETPDEEIASIRRGTTSLTPPARFSVTALAVAAITPVTICPSVVSTM